ncbi:hypothetical protein CTAYLR_005295 [Chrysophaeum taylorii]|uniref:Sugar phosphate transporter domain-containing protein n=1 Tax=Chrysophaeum taylorii TaxID=2483200 RepID=A0AAD7UJB2_9STRA|nr:hypothetical protein CTAYLR_005295 [Chrysophaeum taylorii]
MRDLARKTVEFVMLGSLYLVMTIALIYVNAWIVSDLFPYAATLTMLQMIFCAISSAGLVYGFKVASVPNRAELRVMSRKFVVLGFFYAVYLWGSNLAYKYLEVGFIQILKPLGGFMIYLTLLRHGYETLSTWKALNMIAIFGAVSIASCGQDEIGAFSWVGVSVLLSSLVANSCYYTLLQYLLQPQDDDTKQTVRLNPLTTMLLVGPSAALWLFCVAVSTEWSQKHFEWTLPTWVLLLDCALAFGLNISIMYMLKAFSALTYALCGYGKDVCFRAVL